MTQRKRPQRPVFTDRCVTRTWYSLLNFTLATLDPFFLSITELTQEQHNACARFLVTEEGEVTPTIGNDMDCGWVNAEASHRKSSRYFWTDGQCTPFSLVITLPSVSLSIANQFSTAYDQL